MLLIGIIKVISNSQGSLYLFSGIIVGIDLCFKWTLYYISHDLLRENPVLFYSYRLLFTADWITNYFVTFPTGEIQPRNITRICLVILIRDRKNKGKNPISGPLEHRPKARGCICSKFMGGMKYYNSGELCVITFFCRSNDYKSFRLEKWLTAAESGPVHHPTWSVPLGICNENIQQVRWKETPFIPQRISKNILFRNS